MSVFSHVSGGLLNGAFAAVGNRPDVDINCGLLDNAGAAAEALEKPTSTVTAKWPSVAAAMSVAIERDMAANHLRVAATLEE